MNHGGRLELSFLNGATWVGPSDVCLSGDTDGRWAGGSVLVVAISVGRGVASLSAGKELPESENSVGC